MTAGDVTETKWVRFTELEKEPATRKTLVWEVSGSGGPLDVLGWVEYHGMWHAFIFRTRDVTIRLSVSCMRAIADFVEDRNVEHRARPRVAPGSDVTGACGAGRHVACGHGDPGRPTDCRCGCHQEPA